MYLRIEAPNVIFHNLEILQSGQVSGTPNNCLRNNLSLPSNTETSFNLAGNQTLPGDFDLRMPDWDQVEKLMFY